MDPGLEPNRVIHKTVNLGNSIANQVPVLLIGKAPMAAKTTTTTDLQALAKALNPLKVEKAPKMEKEGQVTSVTTIQLANVEALNLEMAVKALDPVEAQGTWLMKTKFNSGKVPRTIAKALLELEDLVTLILMAAGDQQQVRKLLPY